MGKSVFFFVVISLVSLLSRAILLKKFFSSCLKKVNVVVVGSVDIVLQQSFLIFPIRR